MCYLCDSSEGGFSGAFGRLASRIIWKGVTSLHGEQSGDEIT